MKDDLMISVIMPVYNMEKSLDKAVESVLGQTYGNLELILVDDCSPDGSGKKCDDWAARDNRVRVIHKLKNEGLGAARNSGIAAAKGDYVHFMDSDDWLEHSAYTSVIESLQQNRATVVIFGMTEDYRNAQGKLILSKNASAEAKNYPDASSLRSAVIKLEAGTLYGYACNKAYDLAYLRKIGLQFTDIVLIEDILFNVLFFNNITSMNVLDITPYHYERSVGSSLTARFVKNYFDVHTQRVEMVKDQYKGWGMYTPEVRAILGNIYCRYIYSALQRNCDKRSNMSHKDRKEWLKNLFTSELFIDIVPSAEADSRMMKVLIRFLVQKSVFMILASSRVVFIVKNKMPTLFSRFRQNR